ncbi:MAG: primosomal protein N' [Burkholderiaceae bacterium]|nr:primosomal protein N' [Microbacteriaceae bacterium]
MTAPAPIARVMVDSPLPQLDRLFDYAVPASLVDQVTPGIRVTVPLRSAGRIAEGFVVDIVTEIAYTGTLSELESVVSTVPVLAPEVWALARQVADRAAGTASDVVRFAVPKRQVRVEKAWLAARYAQQDAVPDAGPHAPTIPAPPTEPLGYPAGRIMASLTGQERLAVDAVPRVVELPSGEWVGHWATMMAAGAVAALAAGGSAILAVPDYRDQDQLLAALAAVLPPELIVRLDARQSNPDRYRAVLACRAEVPLAIVGNRSVVYAPAANLGLIALWDDGDPLHTEPLAPYVHTRDAALVRQRQQGSALWFLGHARSTEVERLVEIGFLGVLAPERTYSPKVVPTAAQAPQDRFAALARIPSTAWREARTALDSGPVLVQVARPGYAPRLACDSCGESARCGHCDGPLGTRAAGAVPSCTWCGKPAADWTCGNCAGTTFRLVGQGSVRTADDLGRAFPGIRIIIADGERQVQHVDDRPALIIATRGAEPIAAGGYHAVLLLDGERMLARESLRVGEDCLRWWSNAAALARPGASVVLVGVGGNLASAMATWRPEAYAAAELVDRRRLRFPPAIRVATLTGTAESVEKAVASVTGLAGADVLGPVGVDGGSVRAIVRFDYAIGAAVAAALRSEVIRAATTRRARVPGAPVRTSLPTLKVRCDDTEPFLE